MCDWPPSFHAQGPRWDRRLACGLTGWEALAAPVRPMLDDPAVLEAEQVERDRRSAVTFEALVSGMQQDEIAVHKRAIDRDIGARRARRFRGKRLHSGGTIGEMRVMLDQRFAKIPIDGCRIFLPKDVDHGLASVGAQSVGGHDHSLGPRLLARRAIHVRTKPVQRIGPAAAVRKPEYMPVKRTGVRLNVRRMNLRGRHQSGIGERSPSRRALRQRRAATSHDATKAAIRDITLASANSGA